MSLAYYARNTASAERTRRRIRREGVNMKGDRLWTDEEREIVRRLAPDYDAMVKKLPHRTRIAVVSQAAKMGLRPKIHIWTASEISKLRKMYPTASAEEIVSAFPHSTWVNIQQAARYHGFRRARKPYKRTGIESLDDIREKCFYHRLTMADLDNMCKTKTYFTSMRWKGKKRVNYRAIGRAIEALDGRLSVQWND
ncbi:MULTISPECIES: hypothetical protein [unclassified Sinorhizobium]|uniref:hypothetical protein n=1 Tax=unclassified Sinorhizobium TaxID=2613772 RepID=UPI0024C419FE|nr:MULTISPECIES: hypothetical protein [unclassified Sinorhizobium]MDK1377075.1 hypothetical protein [Sinorhizobium sp. 6-70]MDK1479630.1 hypothetical protein [Sinorhizobium sp. 6-117]